MASKRKAAGFIFSASALFAVAFAAPTLSARPLLPPDPPTFDTPELTSLIADQAPRLDVAPVAPSATETDTQHTPLRRMLADFAMKFRNIAYRRGGREPSTGFDCSGFVGYVFRHSIGLDLPSNSVSQYHAGTEVDRASLKMGDLVFFRTRGKNISHVGIYLDNGLFIHSPSTGKRVRIDRMSESYWAKRYVGAKRPDALVVDAPAKTSLASG